MLPSTFCTALRNNFGDVDLQYEIPIERQTDRQRQRYIQTDRNRDRGRETERDRDRYRQRQPERSGHLREDNGTQGKSGIYSIGYTTLLLGIKSQRIRNETRRT